MITISSSAVASAPLPSKNEMPIELWESDPNIAIYYTSHWSGVCIAISIEDIPLLESALSDGWKFGPHYVHHSRSWRVELYRTTSDGSQEYKQIGELWLTKQHGYQIDHFNRKPLDNTRKNVQVVTGSVNMSNQERRASNNISPIRNIRWSRQNCKWHVDIRVENHNATARFAKYYTEFSDALKAVSIHYPRIKGDAISPFFWSEYAAAISKIPQMNDFANRQRA